MVTETKTFYPSSHWADNTLVSSGSNLTNALGKGSSNTSTKSEIYPAAANTDSFVRWNFDVSSIPQKAAIDSVSCSFRATTRNVSYTSSANAYLCAGNTTKAGASSFLSQSSSVRTLSGGTWTRSELSTVNLLLLWNTKSTTATGGINFYGADLTVTYTYQSEQFMFKSGGTWNAASKVYKKVSGAWVEVTDLTTAIDTSKILKYGGEIISPKKTVTIAGSGNSSNGYVTVNGTKYTSAATVQVESGTTIGITLDCDMYNLLCKVTLNGTVVHENPDTNAATYYHTVDSDCTITLASTGYGGGYKADIVTTGSGSSANLITFTIDGASYQAEQGMTWREWVASSYNTDGLFLDDDETVWDADYDYAVSNGSNLVLSSWTIESGYAYNFV